MDGEGTLYGLSLSGDSLQNHFFIQNATVSATIDGTASMVEGSVTLGAVGLNLVHGSGSLHLQGSLAIVGPTTLCELANVLNGTTSLGSVATTNVAGNAALNLPLQLAVPLAGYTLPNGAQVAVNLPDATNPASLSVSVTPCVSIANLTLAPVLNGLQGLEQFVQASGGQLLSQQLPAIGNSLSGILNPSTLLSTALSNLTQNPPTTIDALVSKLGAILGQPVNASYANGVLQLGLSYNFSKSQNVTLGFALSPSLGSLADVNGSAPLILAVNGSVNLVLHIDFTNPSNPQTYLADNSSIEVGALINSSGVSFSTTVGRWSLTVAGGTVRLDDGNQGNLLLGLWGWPPAH